MKTLLATVCSLFCLEALSLPLNAAAAQSRCPVQLPAGLVIRIYPDEKIVAGKTFGPMLSTVPSDVRFFPHRPALLPGGSKVLAQVVESKKAGRLRGLAKYQVSFTSILARIIASIPSMQS